MSEVNSNYFEISYFKSHCEEQLQKRCIIAIPTWVIAISIVSISTADNSPFSYRLVLVQRVWVTLLEGMVNMEGEELVRHGACTGSPPSNTTVGICVAGTWQLTPTPWSQGVWEWVSLGFGFVKQAQHIILTLNMPALNWQHQAS